MSENKNEAKNRIPVYESRLRHNILRVPEEAYRASGISIFGRRLKTFIFSTDIAIIRNCDADAVFAVYPFTPQIAISEAIIKNAYIPVFCGVGGGTTQGLRTVSLAKDVEAQGAMGVVLNAPVSDENVALVAKSVDIPVVITVVNEDTDIAARLYSGAAILNVAAADKTPGLVKKIREKYPDIPIIATGGPTGATIEKTILAGANAVTYTPPSTKELFSSLMEKYR
ncbi:MAG: hydrolase [Clostridia bacterium]|nr:hydrolase [Clostridia bacterium]